MKFIKLIVLTIITLTTLSACGNKDIFSGQFEFKYAQVKTLDGHIIDKKVKVWAHDSDNDNIRVTFDDGTEYYTNSTNVVLYNK